MPKITKRAVDALRPDRNGKDIFHWDAGDGALKGFGIRVKPSGTAAYLVQYRNKEGRTRRLVIGKVGTLTPDEARTLASDALRAVAKGGDPSAERHAVRRALTVSELCDLYVAGSKGRIKASTWASDVSRIETHVKPLIGRFTVRSLTTADIERMKADIIAGKTARPRKAEGRGGVATGGAGVAARTLGMMVTILEYARKSLKLIKENPARGVTKPPDRKQRQIPDGRRNGQARPSDPRDRGEWRERNGPGSNPLTIVDRFASNGMPRPSPRMGRWPAGCIRFEDTKSGAQLRPIGKKALELITAQPVREGCPWVFPASHGDGHLVGLPKILRRICSKAGLNGVTVHVLRHSFAATAAEMGFSELSIAGLLGHSVPGITARYAHVPDSALVAAADRVATRIASALEGRTEAEIVPLRFGVGA